MYWENIDMTSRTIRVCMKAVQFCDVDGIILIEKALTIPGWPLIEESVREAAQYKDQQREENSRIIAHIMNEISNRNLTVDDLNQYQINNSVSTADACEILNCTCQNIDLLIKAEKIHPTVKLGNNKLFSKADIMSYKFRADNEAYAKEFEPL